MPAPLLEGHELDTYYGQSHVLRGVSVRIGAGETIGLMGRNGMGKTTLIRTLLGLVRPRRGRTRPTSVRISVVLPMPLRPISPTVSPGFTASETPRRMWLWP